MRLTNLSPQPAVDGPLDDAAPARALHDGVHAAVVVRHQQHARGVRARQEDLSDEAAGCRAPRRPSRRRPRSPWSMVMRVRQARRVVPDDPRGQQIALHGVPEIEERTQTLVLELRLGEARRVALEVAHPRAQRVDLLARARHRSTAPARTSATVRLTSVAPRWSGAISSRNTRPSRSSRRRLALVRTISAAATSRKNAAVASSRLRRRNSSMTPRRHAAGHCTAMFLSSSQLVERLAGAQHDGGQRVVGDHHGQAGLLAQQHVEVAQQRAAAGEHDALVDDVGRELGRRPLERRCAPPRRSR